MRVMRTMAAVVVLVASAAVAEAPRTSFGGRSTDAGPGRCRGPRVDAALAAARRASPGRAARKSAEPAPLTFFPMAGVPGEDVFVNNYVDLDAQPDATRDWDCTAYTYDGHRGTDALLTSFAEQDAGVPVFAARDGRVVAAEDGHFDRHTAWDFAQLSNFVAIEHPDGLVTLYFHLRSGSVSVAVDDEVRAGRQIGLVGSSGISDWPHLHFETQRDGSTFDPYSGSCGASETLWAEQEPVFRDFRVEEIGLTSDDLSQHPGMPHAFPRQGVFEVGQDRHVTLWMRVLGLPPGAAVRLLFVRPDGVVGFASPEYDFGNDELVRTSWWWLGHLVDLDVPGTWRVHVLIDGELRADTELEVVAAGTAVANRPPAAIGAVLAPAAPRPTDVVVCRVVGDELHDDADQDLVLHRYVWRAGGDVVRDVTTAARTDALPHSEVASGEELTCEVTPHDGTTSGPGATARTFAVAGRPDGLAPCDAELSACGPEPTFRWAAEEDARHRVTIAAEPDLSGKKVRSGKRWITGGTWQPKRSLWRKALKLARGERTRLWWTLESADGAYDGTAALAAFDVVPPPEPVPLTPPPGASVLGDEAPPTFTWRALGCGERARIEVSPHADFARPVKRFPRGLREMTEWTPTAKEWKQLRKLTKKSPNGLLHWRVVVRDGAKTAVTGRGQALAD